MIRQAARAVDACASLLIQVVFEAQKMKINMKTPMKSAKILYTIEEKVLPKISMMMDLT